MKATFTYPGTARLRQVMKMRGLTSSQLAEATGLSRSAIEKIRTEFLRPSVEAQVKIEKALGDYPIWSSRSQIKARVAAREFGKNAASIAKLEGVNDDIAHDRARERFPSLAEQTQTTRKVLCP